MRRRLVITAIVLDALCGLGGLLAAPCVLAASGEPETNTARYVEVGGMCIERDAEADVDASGWSVDPALCAKS